MQSATLPARQSGSVGRFEFSSAGNLESLSDEQIVRKAYQMTRHGESNSRTDGIRVVEVEPRVAIEAVCGRRLEIITQAQVQC